MIALVLILTASLSLIPDNGSAKRGGDDDRSRYHGIVESRPAQGLHGDWVIGGRTITTSPRTEFNQAEGVLAIGSCAKVDFRNGMVHEIDSEPLHNCR
jgi:hypothetical protein